MVFYYGYGIMIRPEKVGEERELLSKKNDMRCNGVGSGKSQELYGSNASLRSHSHSRQELFFYKMTLS